MKIISTTVICDCKGCNETEKVIEVEFLHKQRIKDICPNCLKGFNSVVIDKIIRQTHKQSLTPNELEEALRNTIISVYKDDFWKQNRVVEQKEI
jgi:hypothetical protein